MAALHPFPAPAPPGHGETGIGQSSREECVKHGVCFPDETRNHLHTLRFDERRERRRDPSAEKRLDAEIRQAPRPEGRREIVEFDLAPRCLAFAVVPGARRRRAVNHEEPPGPV
jgi:hypothetical protein